MRPAIQVLPALALACLTAPSWSATVYSSQASFLAQIAPGSYAETFTDLIDPPGSSGLSFESNGFAYSAAATQGLYVSGGFLSTNQINDVLTISFTSGNVTAIGGNFFAVDFVDALQSKAVTINLSDGTSVDFAPTSLADSFRGFIAAAPINSLVIAAPGQSLYGSIDNLLVGTAVAAVPEPAAAWMLGLGGLVLFARARRTSARATG